MAQVLCPVLVGRDGELGALDDAVAAARAGRGGCAVLVGEPGIGKSRLAREVAARAAAAGTTVVAGRAVPGEGSVPYRPLTEAMLQALRDRPVPDDPELARWLPALAGIVPTLVPAGTPTADAPPPVRAEAVLQLWRWLAAADGLVVVLEDLHWADPDTLSVVEYLADNLTGAPVLLLATVRSEPASPALDLVRRQRGRAGVRQLSLDRLGPDQVAAMVRACAPEASGEQVARVGRTAEGVPLLVEELLASPGLPTSFAETVAERLATLDAEGRRVVDAAAVLGRHFDWALLAAMTGLPAGPVAEALDAAVERLLLSVEAGTFRFRHALTREAVLGVLLPPRQQALAAAGLAAVEAAHPDLAGAWRDVAADLAARAGDRTRAAELFAGSGGEALRRGALATAAATLARALDLGGGDDGTGLLLVEALALAGRVDEAAAAAARTVAALPAGPAGDRRRVELHLRVAQAAVTADRWAMASAELDAVRRLLAGAPGSGLAARLAVLDAAVALAADDTGRARHRALDALAVDGAGADVCCQAHEVIGRVERLTDLPAARASFERALATADNAGLALWRLRALHELGTIDMFERLATARLLEARRTADRLGAVSTVAVLDLQLTALFISRWEPEQAEARARSAIALAERLGLEELRAKTLILLAESHALRARPDGVERCLALIAPIGSSNTSLEGFGWGARGEAALMAGDRQAALTCLDRATALLGRLPHAEPAAFRATWPLLLAAAGDGRAAAAIAEARRLGVEAFNLNRGLLRYADAVLAGRAGDRARATALAREADRGFVNCEAWADLARLLAAEAALIGGWGEPRQWLSRAAETFTRRGLPALAARSRELLGEPGVGSWAGLGVTPREAEVLRLIADGLANKEIAVRLHLSARTVEKHVEALLRKTATRSRTQLAVLARDPTETVQAGAAERNA